MSKPSEEELQILMDVIGDDELYHAEFDRLLEKKLMELDPEWMFDMRNAYRDSEMNRRYA